MHKEANFKEILSVPPNASLFEKNERQLRTVSTEGIIINPEALEGVIYSVDGYELFHTKERRYVVVAKVGNTFIPFYNSTQGTGGKAMGWHPFFGYDGDWLVKGGKEEKCMDSNSDLYLSMTYGRKEIGDVIRVLNVNLQISPDSDLAVTGEGTEQSPYHLDLKKEKEIAKTSMLKINLIRGSGLKVFTQYESMLPTSNIMLRVRCALKGDKLKIKLIWKYPKITDWELSQFVDYNLPQYFLLNHITGYNTPHCYLNNEQDSLSSREIIDEILSRI